jgi:hypothetical protein
MKPEQNETPEQWKLDARRQQAQDLIQLVERFIDFKRWGFQRTYIYTPVEISPSVIYDSEWCRVMFSSEGWEMFNGEVVKVYYGRLHASNEKWFIPWRGKNHLCWHRVNEALNFLDGLTPQEAVEQIPEGKRSRVMDQFSMSETGQRLLKVNQAEWMLGMQAFVWEHYGTRLFGLFDLRRPDLWEQYENFIETYHTIKRSSSPYGWPMPDEIC